MIRGIPLFVSKHQGHFRHSYSVQFAQSPTKEEIMNTTKDGGSRNRRLLLTSVAAIGLMLGGVGIASAATSPNPVQPPAVTPSVPAPAVNEAPDANEAKNANEAPEANEAPDANEAKDANDEVDGVDCENGIDAKTGAECDGGPAANQTDGSAE
jgi:hypothetical protein